MKSPAKMRRQLANIERIRRKKEFGIVLSSKERKVAEMYGF